MTAALFLTTCLAAGEAPWSADFAHQPLAARPRLEVRYADATRAVALIEAETYQLALPLRSDPPRRATVARPDGTALAELHLSAEVGGVSYTAAAASEPSRINLYRRGPYYCDVRWFDVQLVNAAGEALPVRGEVILHCYPEKVHAQVIAHATGAVAAGRLSLALSETTGLAVRTGEPAAWEALAEGDQPSTTLAFAPAAGAAYPVDLDPAATIELRHGLEASYDPVRGSYLVWTDNPGGFSYHYYTNPNHYETATVRLTNGAAPAKVYLCHATRQRPGSVECGVILDERGDPLPLTVQISKNFAGEKEEPFYNPTDIPFSETFVPLYLAAGETRELTSLHLYQNWGNHPLKQFSSLGAWMDYFHSSTGVTETTCFVPFKFGGLPGVSIADFRAMSQRLWASQPQHDNVAGHRHVLYRSGGQWHYSEYLGTTYRSTGPSWMDISLDYLSDDGALRTRLDSFELPQTDELRNFQRLRIDVQAPVHIDDLGTMFRLMDATSRIQRLRFTHAAYGSAGATATVRELAVEDGFALAGVPLEGEAPWAAIYGTRYQAEQGHQMGANAFCVRRFEARLGGQSRGPAVAVETHESGDTNLALTVAGGQADLVPGDFVEVDFYLMPYGDDDDDDATPREDSVRYGPDAPRMTSVAAGTKLSDFPTRLRAEGGRAEFSLAGGANAVPVIIEGLTDRRPPRMEQRIGEAWREVKQSTVGNDGVQTFVAEDGSFGAVFLVAGGAEQTYRLAAPAVAGVRVWRQQERPEQYPRNLLAIQAEWMTGPLLLRFPETINSRMGLHQIDHHRDDMIPLVDGRTLEGWHPGPGGSWWFDWTLAEGCRAGGIATPREDYVDLEFWFFNGSDEPTHVHTQFCLMLHSPELRDGDGRRQYIRSGGRWVAMAETDRGRGKLELSHYPIAGGPSLDWIQEGPDGWGRARTVADVGLPAVVSTDGRHVMGIHWQRPPSMLSNWHIPCFHADPTWPNCPPGEQVRVKGRIWLLEGGLDELWARWEADFGG